MRKAKDITGQHFGRWTVQGPKRFPSGRAGWLCLCDPDRGGCGVKKIQERGNLSAMRTLRCAACMRADPEVARKKSRAMKGRAPTPQLIAGRARRHKREAAARGPRNRAIAAAVLDEGRTQVAVAAEHQLTGAQVSRIVAAERSRRSE